MVRHWLVTWEQGYGETIRRQATKMASGMMRSRAISESGADGPSGLTKDWGAGGMHIARPVPFKSF